MPRFFVNPDQVSGDKVTITGPDVAHITQVLRMRPGDTISISDGCGRDYFCEILLADKAAVTAKVCGTWDSYTELSARITLFQGLPKGDKMDLIIQKAVELGAYSIVPVICARTIVRLDEKKTAHRLARWQQISESAAKQSGRSIIPVVHAPVDFKTAAAMAKSLSACLIPYEQTKGMEEARQTIRSLTGAASIGVMIGPEGGFEPEEVELACANGAKPISLGRRILRTETAGMTALSVLMFELDQ